MPHRLSMRPATAGDSQGRNKADRTFKHLPGSRGWHALPLIFLGLGLLAGCGGGPSQQIPASPTPRPMHALNLDQGLQNQLMLQATRASLASYRDYQVGAEDQLEIVVFGQDNLNRILRVNGRGEITMPLVGVVPVAGLTPQEIEKRLVALYDAQYLVDPQISVEVKEFRHQRVAVTGAVDKPGTYEIIGPRTLLEVLSLAGGFSSRTGAPAGDVVNLIRHQNAPDLAKAANAGTVTPAPPFTRKTETMVINLRRLVSGQTPELNLPVRNGDVIHVPFAGTAYVLGGVRKPGNVAVKENLTVSQAVALAGGIDPLLGTNDITVMRFDEQGRPISIKTDLGKIIARDDPDLPLKDNDVLVVRESSLKKTLYVIRTLLPIPSGSYSMSAF